VGCIEATMIALGFLNPRSRLPRILRRSLLVQDGVRPSVIGVQKVVTAFFVAQLRKNAETRTDGMSEPHRSRETDVKTSWKLTVHTPHIDVAM
jgi:hypothetical protein